MCLFVWTVLIHYVCCGRASCSGFSPSSKESEEHVRPDELNWSRGEGENPSVRYLADTQWLSRSQTTRLDYFCPCSLDRVQCVWLLHTAKGVLTGLALVGHPADRRAASTRADADCNSTSKGAAASCGWSDKTALQCKNVNDQGLCCFRWKNIYRAKWERVKEPKWVYGCLWYFTIKAP